MIRWHESDVESVQLNHTGFAAVSGKSPVQEESRRRREKDYNYSEKEPFVDHFLLISLQM